MDGEWGQCTRGVADTATAHRPLRGVMTPTLVDTARAPSSPVAPRLPGAPCPGPGRCRCPVRSTPASAPTRTSAPPLPRPRACLALCCLPAPPCTCCCHHRSVAHVSVVRGCCCCCCLLLLLAVAVACIMPLRLALPVVMSRCRARRRVVDHEARQRLIIHDR